MNRRPEVDEGSGSLSRAGFFVCEARDRQERQPPIWPGWPRLRRWPRIHTAWFGLWEVNSSERPALMGQSCTPWWPSVVRLGLWLVAHVAVVRLPLLLPGTRTSAMPARQAPSISWSTRCFYQRMPSFPTRMWTGRPNWPVR